MPEPIVEVAEHDQRQGVGDSEQSKSMRLVMPFAQAQSEMHCNRSELACRRLDDGLECGARLTAAHGNVVPRRVGNRPSRQQNVTVVTLRCDYHARLGTMLTQAR